jgi:hypothetical protein
MRNLNTVFILPLLLVFLHSAVSHAQQNAEQQIGPWVWGVQGGVVHQFDTDLSDADGDFSLNRYIIRPSVGYAWGKHRSISLSLGLVEYDYNFSSQAKIGDQKPWGKIREYRVSVPIRFRPSKNTQAIIIPSIVSRAEKGASIDDGKSERVLAGISWRVSDTLKIGPGFGWKSSLGGGSSLFPVLMIEWWITEKLSLTTGSAFAASRGPGLSLNYDLNKDWQVSLAVRNEKTRFALDDKSTTPGGFGRDKNVPVYVSVQYSPWKLTKLSAFVSSKFNGALSLEDSQRKNISHSDYDVAYSIGLTFKSRF